MSCPQPLVACETPEGMKIAAEFASVLQKITDQPVQIREDVSVGIVLGIAADFPGQAKEAKLNPEDPFSREDYLIRSSSDRLLILGTSLAGLHHGVADVAPSMGFPAIFPIAGVGGDPQISDVVASRGRNTASCFLRSGHLYHRLPVRRRKRSTTTGGQWNRLGKRLQAEYETFLQWHLYPQRGRFPGPPRSITSRW